MYILLIDKFLLLWQKNFLYSSCRIQITLKFFSLNQCTIAIHNKEIPIRMAADNRAEFSLALEEAAAYSI